MRTSKPFSLVSYNTLNFLEKKLIELKQQDYIYNAFWIFHKGEFGDKDHTHLYLYPSTTIDTSTLKSFFQEISIGSDLPLGISPIVNTIKNDDTMVLYALHDDIYMNAIQEDKEYYNYSVDDFHSLDEHIKCSVIASAFNYREKKLSVKLSSRVILECFDNGMLPMDIIRKYNPPTYQNAHIFKMFDMLTVEYARIKSAKTSGFDEGYQLACEEFNPFVE